MTEFTDAELQNEQWKPVNGFESFYSVSTLGRVRTDVARNKVKVGHLLAPHVSKRSGYVSVCLFDTKKHTTRLNVVIARAFLGPPPDGHQVNHIDGNKQNNRLSNLEYLTAQDNALHAVRLGLWPTGKRNGAYTRPDRVPRGDRNGMKLHPERAAKGEACARSKLSASDVRDIKQRLKQNERVCDIAKLYPMIDMTNISHIKNGKTWRHITA